MIWHILIYSFLSFLSDRTLDIAPPLSERRHPNGWYPIHAAVLTGNLEMVKLILGKCGEQGLSYKDAWKYDDCDNLSAADLQTRGEELGALVKTTKTEGCTPLRLACLTGDVDIIEYLVKKGASFQSTDNGGRDPLEYLDIERHASAFKACYGLTKCTMIGKKVTEDCMHFIYIERTTRLTTILPQRHLARMTGLGQGINLLVRISHKVPLVSTQGSSRPGKR